MFTRLLHSLREIKLDRRGTKAKEQEIAIKLLQQIFLMDYSSYRAEGGVTLVHAIIDADLREGLELIAQNNKYKRLLGQAMQNGEKPWQYAMRCNARRSLQFYFDNFEQKDELLFADERIRLIIQNDVQNFQDRLSKLEHIPRDDFDCDYLTYATWLGHMDLIKLMLADKKHQEKFDIFIALRSSILEFQEEACYYLLDRVIATKKIDELVDVLEHLNEGACLQKVIAEKLIDKFTKSDQLSDQDKARLCYPLLCYILLYADYASNDDFNIVFAQAMASIKTSVSIEKKLKAYIRQYIFAEYGNNKDLNLTIFFRKISGNAYFSVENLYLPSLRPRLEFKAIATGNIFVIEHFVAKLTRDDMDKISKDEFGNNLAHCAADMFSIAALYFLYEHMPFYFAMKNKDNILPSSLMKQDWFSLPATRLMMQLFHEVKSPFYTSQWQRALMGRGTIDSNTENLRQVEASINKLKVMRPIKGNDVSLRVVAMDSVKRNFFRLIGSVWTKSNIDSTYVLTIANALMALDEQILIADRVSYWDYILVNFQFGDVARAMEIAIAMRQRKIEGKKDLFDVELFAFILTGMMLVDELGICADDALTTEWNVSGCERQVMLRTVFFAFMVDARDASVFSVSQIESVTKKIDALPSVKFSSVDGVVDLLLCSEVLDCCVTLMNWLKSFCYLAEDEINRDLGKARAVFALNLAVSSRIKSQLKSILKIVPLGCDVHHWVDGYLREINSSMQKSEKIAINVKNRAYLFECEQRDFKAREEKVDKREFVPKKKKSRVRYRRRDAAVVGAMEVEVVQKPSLLVQEEKPVLSTTTLPRFFSTNIPPQKRSARDYMNMGDYDRALQILNEMTQASRDISAFINLAFCYEKMGNFTAALKVYADLRRKRIDVVLPWARCLEAKGSYDEAIALLETPDVVERGAKFLLALAYLYIKKEQFDTAIGWFKQIPEYMCNDRAVRGLAICYRGKHDYRAMVLHCEEVLRVGGGDVDAVILAADSYRRIGEYTKAVDILGNIPDWKSNEKVLLALAVAHEARGDNVAALNCLDLIYQVGSSRDCDVDYLYCKLLAVLRDGNTLVEIDKAIDAWPSAAAFHLLKARYLHQHHSRLAIDVLSNAIKRFPYEAQLYLSIIEYYSLLNDTWHVQEYVAECEQRFSGNDKLFAKIALLQKIPKKITLDLPDNIKAECVRLPGALLVGGTVIDILQAKYFGKRDKAIVKRNLDLDFVVSAVDVNVMRTQGFSPSHFVPGLFTRRYVGPVIDVQIVPDAPHWVNNTAKARDFTVCALFVNAAGEILDPTNQGWRDFHMRKLRMIGSAADRVSEDPVRLLRAIRYMCRGFSPDAELERAIHHWQAINLSENDKSKIRYKVYKHLEVVDACDYVQYLQKYGLLEKMFGIVPHVNIADTVDALNRYLEQTHLAKLSLSLRQVEAVHPRASLG